MMTLLGICSWVCGCQRMTLSRFFVIWRGLMRMVEIRDFRYESKRVNLDAVWFCPEFGLFRGFFFGMLHPSFEEQNSWSIICELVLLSGIGRSILGVLPQRKTSVECSDECVLVRMKERTLVKRK